MMRRNEAESEDGVRPQPGSGGHTFQGVKVVCGRSWLNLSDKDIYNAEFCGHLINNSSIISFPGKDKLYNRKLKNLVRNYYTEGEKLRNSTIMNGIVYALKDIRKVMKYYGAVGIVIGLLKIWICFK